VTTTPPMEATLVHERDPDETPQRQRKIRRPQPDRSGAIPLGVLTIAVAALVVPPLISIVIRSFTTVTPLGEPGEPTLRNFASLTTQGGLAQTLINTAVTTIGSTLLALIIGGGLAWVVERTNAPGGGVCRLMMLISLSIPYILYAISWIMLLGPDGPINSATQHIGFTIGANSITAMIIVEALIAAPLAFLFLGAVLRTIDASLEEAAAISGAGHLQTLLRVTGPLALPGILGVGLLILIRILESFEIPALIGLPGGIHVMTTMIFLDSQRFPPNYGTAGAYAVLLMLAVVVLLYFANRLNRRADAFATVTGKPTQPRTIDLGTKRWVGTAAITVFGLFALIAPMVMIVWASLVTYYHAPSLSGLAEVTLDNYRDMFAQATFLSSVMNTIVVGTISATAVMAIAAVGVWLSLRLRAPGGPIFDQFAMTPLVIPGVILGFSLAAFYLSVPLPIYATLWILVIGYTTRYLPFGMRYATAGMVQIHRSLEEAADVGGARRWTTFRRVVLPIARPALVAGWVFIFLMASKELSMAVLLASPGNEVLSVSMYHQWINGQTNQVATIGVLWAAFLSLVMLALFLFTRRRGVSFAV
jgi:iron(III) transport system permease protein